MFKMKKVFTGAVLCAAMLSMTVMNAFAANDPSTDDSQTIDPNSGATILVTGEVSATVITVTVPISVSFAINPNNDSPLTVPTFSFKNNSTAPVNVSYLGFTSNEGTSAKVVEQDKFEDWSALASADTRSNIALGLSISDSTHWSEKETGTAPSTAIATMLIEPKSSLDNITIDVKHGNAWDEAVTLAYKMHLKVSLPQSSN